jgi:putative DNA methylase
MRSFWLCKKASSKWALRYKVVRPQGHLPQVEFEVFEPKTDQEVPAGTVTRAKATCLCCNTVLSPDRVRRQLSDQRGGADVIFDGQENRIGGARLLAAVTLNPGEQGRQYRLPRDRDYEAVHNAMKALEKIAATKLPNDLNPIPDEPLPPIGTLGFRVQRYGMLQWGDLFTARQKLAMITLVHLVHETRCSGTGSHDRQFSQLLQSTLGLGVSKLADLSNSLCSWEPSMTRSVHLFARQAIPMVWDFSETAVLSEVAGNYGVAINNMARIPERERDLFSNGDVELASAMEHPLPDESAHSFFTDPPYYDAVPYADLSDFFFVWLKRIFSDHPLLRDPFDPQNPLTPKLYEVVQDETKRVNGRPKDRTFFEEAMTQAFAEGRRVLRDDGIGSVVFAHKTTEGWEALLAGMIRGGWIITGSWPISTEWGTRLRARESAALATSVHLVCRPRPEDAPVGDWGEVLRELPRRVGNWMERLQAESVRGADLVFACIGPALEILSRYAKVETADGREVPLAEYLEKVWEVVGRAALEQVLGTVEAQVRNGGAGALEEDARLTALFLWTLQGTNGNVADATPNDSAEDSDEDEPPDEEDTPSRKLKGYTLVFDVVRRFAQPLGIHLPAWEQRIIETKKGVVRLLPVSDRAQQLFGEGGAQLVADQLERASNPSTSAQLALFPEASSPPKTGRQGRRKSTLDISDDALHTRHEATTLDRLHAAMLLQSSGHTNALRVLLHAEQDRGPDFLRLANALSALYPAGSEEKRLLDAMLLVVPR